MITKVKICGITNYEDAMAAMDMGADLLGFNFYPQSPRYIKPQNAAEIIQKLPAFIDVSGVFVNSSLEEIREIAACASWIGCSCTATRTRSSAAGWPTTASRR